MAKKKVEDVVTEIKKLIEENKVMFGVETTVKKLRQGGLKKVFLSSGCNPSDRETIQRLCKMADVECVELKQDNEEMGGLCRKPFSISVIGVKA